jgi:hypothetical protein
VDGRQEVVVIAAGEFQRLKGNATGGVLITAMRASPDHEVEIAPERTQMPVRDAIL